MDHYLKMEKECAGVIAGMMNGTLLNIDTFTLDLVDAKRIKKELSRLDHGFDLMKGLFKSRDSLTDAIFFMDNLNLVQIINRYHASFFFILMNSCWK